MEQHAGELFWTPFRVSGTFLLSFMHGTMRFAVRAVQSSTSSCGPKQHVVETKGYLLRCTIALTQVLVPQLNDHAAAGPVPRNAQRKRLSRLAPARIEGLEKSARAAYLSPILQNHPERVRFPEDVGLRETRRRQHCQQNLFHQREGCIRDLGGASGDWYVR